MDKLELQRREKQLVDALKMEVIDWFQYFDAIKRLYAVEVK